MDSLFLTLAQCNPKVGDVDFNIKLLKACVNQSSESDVIVFPELFLVGYPPEDLLFRAHMPAECQRALVEILEFSKTVPNLTLVYGSPIYEQGGCYNGAIAVCNGEVVSRYAKKCLPNFNVFDEKRYFIEGEQKGSLTVKGYKLGLSICEDIWRCDSIFDIVEDDVDMILSLNASPFYAEKQPDRVKAVMNRAKEANAPLVYCNLIGGQDELVFDGGSMIGCPQNGIVHQQSHFVKEISTVEMHQASDKTWQYKNAYIKPDLSYHSECYQTLILGTRDYIRKNGFSKVVLGLSGGIDSALTLAVAVDAVGAENVTAVMMPFHYTADISKEDAAEQAKRMGVEYYTLPIESAYDAFEGILAQPFEGLKPDVTEQNMQSRCRGLILMAISNKTGALVLTTGNKSEVAVGYCTLYGDMCGAYCVPKDIYKTKVYELATFRNSLTPDNPPIPERVITREPSAELAPDQIDSDSLPEYEILDAILEHHIEGNLNADAIIEKGFERKDVERVLWLVKINEYKRFQAAPGPRVTKRGFGKDWRIPLTQGMSL